MSSGVGAGCPSAVPLLDYALIDAEYSRSLDLLVTVSADPPELHLHGPDGPSAATLPLNLPPAAVSVSPDGLLAVIGHDHGVTLADLSSTSIVAFYPVTLSVGDAIAAANGFAYLFSDAYGTHAIHAVDLFTGEETLSAYPNVTTVPVVVALHPDGDRAYGTGGDTKDVERYDLSGPVVEKREYLSSHPTCRALWGSEDDTQIITRCGSVFRTSAKADDDVVYDGSLDLALIRALWHSGDVIAALPQRESADDETTVGLPLILYDDRFYERQAELPLPCIDLGSSLANPVGRFVFRTNSDEYLVVLEPPQGSAAGGRKALALLRP